MSVRLVVLCALVASGCTRIEANLDGLSCTGDEGCLDEFTCHPELRRCVPTIVIGCGIVGGWCPESVETGETCPSVGSFLPCPDSDLICTNGCRTCQVDLTWTDCPSCRPTGPETCNGLDDDCNGAADDLAVGTTNAECTTRHAGAKNVAEWLCAAGDCYIASCVAGFADGSGGAADGCESICYPTEPPDEICDGADNDCDGRADPEDTVGCASYYRDDDRDSVGQTSDSRCLCGGLPPYDTNNEGDCDDTSATCSDNCELNADADAFADCDDVCIDADNDGFGSPGGGGHECLGPDCNDTEPAANAGLSEGPPGHFTCSDGIDNDCDGVADGDDGDCRPWWSCDWRYRRRLLIAPVAEALADFPLLVVLDSSRIDYRATLGGGNDVRFIDADGNQLPHEVELWNPSGRSFVWVLVPEMKSDGAGTAIWMYHGNPSVAPDEQPNLVWDSGYAGVWHFDEDPGGGPNPQMLDSTKNGYDGTTAGMVGADRVSGRVGRCLEFDGFTEYVDMGDPPGLNITGAFTVEAWIYPYVSPTDMDEYPRIIHRWAGDGGYGLFFNQDGSELTLNTEDDTSQQDILRLTHTIQANRWYYVAGTWSPTPGQTAIFINGAEQIRATSTLSAINGVPQNVQVGGQGVSNTFNGRIDEVRVSNIERRPAWFAAQHASMTDSLVTFGPEQVQGWGRHKVLVINPDRVPEALTNFPMLVSLPDHSALEGIVGEGIVFTTADGITKLSHEIEASDPSSGSLVAWVKVPFISPQQPTRILMHYDNTNVPAQSRPAEVWSDGYEAVYHLNAGVFDSTQRHDGVDDGTVSSAGMVGDGRSFDDSRVDLGNWSVAGSELTVQTWVNIATSAADSRFISKASGGSINAHVWMLSLTNSTKLRMRVKTGDEDASGTTTLSASGDDVQTGIWFSTAGTYDGQTMRLFKDGQQIASTGKTGLLRQNGWPIRAGDNPNTDYGQLYGALDEIRISSVARSTGWLAAEYANQATPSIFYGLGEEVVPAPHCQ